MEALEGSSITVLLSSIRPEDATSVCHSERFQAKFPYKEETQYITIILRLSFETRGKKRKGKKNSSFHLHKWRKNWNVCIVISKIARSCMTLFQHSLNRNVLTFTKYTLSIWIHGSSLFGLSYLCVTAIRSSKKRHFLDVTLRANQSSSPKHLIFYFLLFFFYFLFFLNMSNFYSK